jgi:tetratricopeptide (TPR) repeat protein
MSTPPARPAAKAPDRAQRLRGLQRIIQDGAIDLALRGINHWLQTAPEDPDLWTLKAGALHQNGKLDDAMRALQKAADLQPKKIELRLQLARLAHDRGDGAEEIKALTSAVAIGPIPDRLLMRLINLQMGRHDFDEAIANTDKLVALKPAHEPYLLKRANCLMEAGRLADAEAVLNPLVAKENPSDSAIIAWGQLLADRGGRVEEVVERLHTLVAKPSASWMVHAALGKALVKLNRVGEAIKIFKRATELAPDQAINWYDLGVLQREVGQVAESQASLMRSLELDPANPGALRVAGYEHKYSYGDDAFKRVNLALSRVHKLPKKSQLEVHYAAAKALEDIGELDSAFEHYSHAGQLQKELTPWSDTRMRGVLAMMKNYLRPEDYQKTRQEGFRSNKPTLIEQVIASHPQAFGAGELKLGAGVLNGIKIGRTVIETTHDGKEGMLADCQGMSIYQRGQKYVEVLETFGGAEPLRIVDKMPGNYNWVGLLDAVIPGSYFIHSRRHPMDTCLSMYRIFFPDGIGFSYDLRDLGKAYRLYHDYMKYWSDLLPKERILHVRYEDMVADLETQARRMIDFIQLPWNDACLRFYETERKVRTASVTQVRRPIYKDAVNRWRKYESYLKPLLDELGPLVKEYEDELAATYGES